MLQEKQEQEERREAAERRALALAEKHDRDNKERIAQGLAPIDSDASIAGSSSSGASREDGEGDTSVGSIAAGSTRAAVRSSFWTLLRLACSSAENSGVVLPAVHTCTGLWYSPDLSRVCRSGICRDMHAHVRSGPGQGGQ
eukprot:COSAG05_NODE_147_length_16383_cov_266.102555_5_plen_141_part_00